MRFTTKAGQVIVCTSHSDFDYLRGKYFPAVDASKWTLDVSVTVEEIDAAAQRVEQRRDKASDIFGKVPDQLRFKKSEQ